ncbi:MAG: subclass B1 metallo-beta-lactamase [Prolixibacteraceae bacterium]|nr:subclass B1 metallo-beta-lactamase [Prolixibacteraceae bacterium]
MNQINYTKQISIIIAWMILIANDCFAQEIKISGNLTVFQLSEHCYVHTQNNNNGLVYLNNGEALIVSTPDTDTETQNLINWVRDEKHAQIVAYIIDRWHPDAMGGLKTVQKNGIKNYAYELTRQIAGKKGLPVPEIGFNPKKTIKVGGEKVICHYLGEAHTTDGIVVWIPNDSVLFGGNEIRNDNGWIGNIGDANLDKWSETVTNIKKEYGSAKIVIPGHGMHGGAALIDYTIELYRNVQNSKINHSDRLDSSYISKKEITLKADSILFQNGMQILKNAVVIAQDSTKYVLVESPEIIFSTIEKTMNSETGRLRIYDKKPDGEIIRTDVFFKNMTCYKIDDTVGLVVILKEIMLK